LSHSFHSLVFFAIRFICPAHRLSSYCVLPTVRLVSSSVIRIGSSLFTNSVYCPTEERARIYHIYSLEHGLIMGHIWPISFLLKLLSNHFKRHKPCAPTTTLIS
jgi:hypothetical protein